MSRYYTNVVCFGNKILYRGVNNRQRVKNKIDYSPTMFVPSKKKSEYKSLFGENLEPIEMGDIREGRDFLKKYSDVENFKIYGNEKFEYSFIADHFKGMIDWAIDEISIAIIDIEVGSENGFPDPYIASEPITAIGIKRLGQNTIVYACGDYNNHREDVTYIKCRDEYTLCKRFLEDWSDDHPDIVSGWNVKFFDIPYIVNRFTRILGESEVKKLSPWNYIGNRKTNVMMKELIVYDFLGITTLDYLEAYKWFAPSGKSQESYRLDNIAQVELGEGKLSYDEYENLHELYKLDFQKFIDYNIKDVELILKLEDKLKLFDLCLTLAYDTKCNFGDVFTQTRMWDALIYNYLLERKIIVPPKEMKFKDGAFEGAYVKEPQLGIQAFVASFDLNSMYPHLMMQYNLSPETLVDPKDYTDEMREILNQNVTIEKLLEQKIDLSKLDKRFTITPNGEFFRTDIQGFLPKMLEEMYEDRSKFKKMMIDAKKKYEVETDKQLKYDLEKKISRYNNLQLAKKVSLNSAYGALGSKYFRFYDLRIALAVTLSGKLSIRWIENHINQYMNHILKTNGKDYVIASDTDSIYLRLGDLVNKVYSEKTGTEHVIAFMDRVCEQKIQPFIDESYQKLAAYVNAYAQKMQMKRESLADKGIWTAKKRYIMNVYNNEGVQYKTPKMKVMGLEMVKSSTPAAIREKMKQSIELILRGNEDEVQKFINEFKEQFFKLPAEEISFPRGVNGLAEYSDSSTLYKKGTPIHVKGAILYNHNLKKLKLEKKYPMIQEGEKLKFTYLKKPNPFMDTVISYPNRLPKEFGLQDYIDYETQFEKAFLDPIRIILDSIGWSTEKKSTLDSFFG
jgi:DNA polymerase elongation subunit (family B)